MTDVSLQSYIDGLLAPILTAFGNSANQVQKLYTITGTPASTIGNLGDFSIDPSTGLYYQKSTAGWASIGTFKGAAGNNPRGSWNAATNTPTLTSGGIGGAAGDLFIVATAGTTSLDGNAVWGVPDIVVNTGTAWVRVALSTFFGTMAQQSASAATITGGTMIGMSMIGVTDQTTTPVPDLIRPTSSYVWTFEDPSGNIAGGVSPTGQFIWQTAQISSLTIQYSNIATLTVSSSVVLGPNSIKSIPNLQGPNYYSFLWSWEDAAGNITGGLLPDGTFLFGTVNIATLSATTVSISKLTIGGVTTDSMSALLPSILDTEEDSSGSITKFVAPDGRVFQKKADPAYSTTNKARRSQMATVSPPISAGGDWGTNITGPMTLRSVWSLEDDFDYVRLIFFNDRAPPGWTWGIASAMVAPSAALGNYVTPTGGWQTVTFNNAGADLPYYAQNSGTVESITDMSVTATPTAPSDNDCLAFYPSDWINCRSLPRTDGGKFSLLNISVTLTGRARALTLPVSGSPVGAGLGAYGGSDWLGGRVFQCYSASGDYTTTNQTGFPAPTASTTPSIGMQPCMVQVILRNGRAVTLMNVGDSIASGDGSYLASAGLVHKVTLGISQPAGTGLPVFLNNLAGWGASSPQNYLRNAKNMLSLVKPQILMLQTWSRNGSPDTWTATTPYANGALITDANGNIQQVSDATGLPGTSGSTVPTWAATVNATTTDGTLLWTCLSLEGTTWTQAEADFMWRGVMDLAYEAEAWGCVPILIAPVPNLLSTNGTGYGEPFRLSARTRTLQAGASGMVTMDFEAILGQATPGTPLNPNSMIVNLSLAGNGVHPNDPGQSLMAQIGMPKIRAILDIER